MKKSVQRKKTGLPKPSLGSRIQQRLAALNRSAMSVSVAIGAHEDFIRNIYRKEGEGKRHSPGSERLTALAKELETTTDWLLYGDAGHVDSSQIASEMEAEGSGVVPVVGYVGAGSAAHFYAISQGSLDLVPAPRDVTPSTVCVEIRGTSMGAMFDRWLAYYDDVRSPVTDDLIGCICVVGLTDGRVLMKEIQQSKLDGRYDLISATEPPIEGVELEWAAKVKQMAQK